MAIAAVISCIAVVGGSELGVIHLGALIPSVFAQADPLGAGGNSGSARTDPPGMSVTGTDQFGNPLANGDAIYAGETIHLKLNYHVVSKDPSAYDGYIFSDSTNAVCSQTSAWVGCLSNGSKSAQTDQNDQKPAPDNGTIEQNDNCPSFWYNSDSPFYDGLQGGGGNFIQALDWSHQGKPYAWSDLLPGDPGHQTCLTQGLSEVWHGIDMSSTGNHSYSVDFTPNVAFPQGLNRSVCFQGNITYGDVNGIGGLTNGGDLYYTTNNNSLCLKLNVPNTISGYVVSDPVNATGRDLSNVPITLDDCHGNDTQSTTTAADGSFSVAWDEGEPFCMSSAAATPGTPYWADGSPYGSVTPACASGLCNVASPTISDHCWSTSCGNYSYTYGPLAQPTTPTKTASPASGTALTPGQRITYSMTTQNPYDDNINVDAVHGEQLDDEIPLNIDPTTVSNVTASVSSIPGGPSNWSFNVSLPCNQIVNPFHYGHNGSDHQANAQCGYTPPSAGGSSPGYVWVTLSAMPAYSQITLSWGGNVYNAGSVGVYPTNGAYCANGAGTYFGIASSVLANCSDFQVGEQGVSNFAYDWIAADISPTYSNNTYNPIPGDIQCVGKWSPDAQTEFGYALQNGACGTSVPTPPDKWVYSNDSPDYASADFNINVRPDNTAGPVYYYITDQDDGKHSSSDNSALKSGSVLDPALVNVSSLSGAGYDSGNILHWDNINSATAPSIAGNIQVQSFHVAFTSVSNGYVATNAAKACYPIYWDAPASAGNYPTQCVGTTVPLSITQQAITGPYVTSSNGDIHAGGGASNTNSCTTPPIVLGSQNPGANGQYFVTASGNLAVTDKQQFFDSEAGTASNWYGTICRPDIVSSTDNYAAKAGESVAYNGNPASPGYTWSAANQAANDGKVVVANSSVSIPANTVISARWTLLVHNSNVNIPGNVTLIPADYNGQPEAQHASFGVVVDNGNVNIDKTVSNLEGFYFASPNSSGGNGVIDTCAGPNGSPTLSPSGSYDVGDCSGQLTVTGLMMAYGFRLSRTTDPNTGPAENVQFDDRLYTATPPGFSDLGQGYIPPLYLPESNSRY